MDKGRLRLELAAGEQFASLTVNEYETLLMQQQFAPPEVDADTLLTWVADWIRAGNPLLGRPTKFERRDGRF